MTIRTSYQLYILVRCCPLEEVVPSPRLPPQHRQARYWLTEAEARSSLQLVGSQLQEPQALGEGKF